MIFYVFIGGMKGTTWVQIIKATLLLIGVGIMSVWMLALFGFNFSAMLGEAVATAGNSAILDPGLQYGATTLSKIDFLSLGLALVLGTAGLPHVLMRFYTVPTAKEARKSVVWAICLIGGFYLCTLVLGFGAAAMLGPEVISNAPGGQNSAAPLLAYELGGTLLLGVIAAVAFATILAVVAGLTITASASFAHDIYEVIKKGKLDTKGRNARRTMPPWSSLVSWPSWAVLVPKVRIAFWLHWPSLLPPQRICPQLSTRCSGSASPLVAPCGLCTVG